MEKKSVRRREIERMPAEKWCDSPFTRETQTDAVTEWQCWIHNLLNWNKHDKNDVNMSITILSLPHILLHPPNLWKHCGGVPPHAIHHNVYKVSMYSIIHETFMTFNSPCCCARSLVSVKTLSSWYKDKCVGVCSCSPARHIYFFFFFVIRSLPPYSNHLSPSLSLSDRLSSVTASAGIPHRRAAKS